MTKPKLAAKDCVNTVVCVKNPGPIADVAIKKAAPKSNVQLPAGAFVFLFCFKWYSSFCQHHVEKACTLISAALSSRRIFFAN